MFHPPSINRRSDRAFQNLAASQFAYYYDQSIMPTSLLTLPPELLLSIVEAREKNTTRVLSRKDLLAIRRVCRHLHDVVSPLLFKELSVSYHIIGSRLFNGDPKCASLKDMSLYTVFKSLKKLSIFLEEWPCYQTPDVGGKQGWEEQRALRHFIRSLPALQEVELEVMRTWQGRERFNIKEILDTLGRNRNHEIHWGVTLRNYFGPELGCLWNLSRLCLDGEHIYDTNDNRLAYKTGYSFNEDLAAAITNSTQLKELSLPRQCSVDEIVKNLEADAIIPSLETLILHEKPIRDASTLERLPRLAHFSYFPRMKDTDHNMNSRQKINKRDDAMWEILKTKGTKLLSLGVGQVTPAVIEYIESILPSLKNLNLALPVLSGFPSEESYFSTWRARRSINCAPTFLLYLLPKLLTSLKHLSILDDQKFEDFGRNNSRPHIDNDNPGWIFTPEVANKISSKTLVSLEYVCRWESGYFTKTIHPIIQKCPRLERLRVLVAVRGDETLSRKDMDVLQISESKARGKFQDDIELSVKVIWRNTCWWSDTENESKIWKYVSAGGGWDNTGVMEINDPDEEDTDPWEDLCCG